MRAQVTTVSYLPITFVIGMRRSGTTITQQCLNHCGMQLAFEPRDLWWALTQGHLTRYRSTALVAGILDGFLRQQDENGGTGCKFALEPGISGMYWRYVPLQFPEARFVFVVRNWWDTYRSYYKQDIDEPQGVVSKAVFRETHGSITKSFGDFVYASPTRAGIVDYDVLVRSRKLPGHVLGMLGIEKGDIAALIKTPEHTQGAETR